MAAMSPLGSGCIADLSISLLLDCTRPSEANLPMTAASTTPSWGPSIPSIAVLTADEHGRLVEFQHAPDGKTPHDSEGSFRLRCYLHHSQIFKLSPVFQMWLMDDTQPGVMRKMAYARTFGVRFRSEEASNSFFTAVQDWKSTGHDVANGTMESSKSLNKFDKKIEAASAKMYFHYYGQLLHQQNMLQDYIRTGTYYAAVVENQTDFQGCVVVDVGAGSGILSLFAAQAGAKHVYAIEASRMAEYAQKLIAGNPSLSSRITVIQGKVEEVELPEKADILISEPMGTLLVNERMLESYIIARDRFLVPKGKMFPALGRVHIAPFSDEYLHLEIASKALFWQQKNYYGVDLTALHNSAFQGYFTQPVVDAFDPRILLAPPVSHTLDFSIIKEEELFEIDVPFNFTIAMSTRVHGLACWFDVLFDGSTSQRWLTTAPGAPTTHWYQLRCVLSQPLYIMAGQTIMGHLNLVAHSSQSYTINLTMSVKMCGTGAGQNGIIQTASGKFDLKEPFYRMSQVQAYSGSQDQQLQQMQIQQAIQPTQQQSQQTEVPNGTQQAFGISQVSLSSSALLQQQHQQPNQIQQQQQPQFYQQPSWNSQ